MKDPLISYCNERCDANTSKYPDKKYPFIIYEFGIKYQISDFIDKLKSYFRAEYSYMRDGELCDEKFQKRMFVCKGCEHLVQTDDPVGHCGKCGCSTSSKRAGLTVKGKMPMATCPENKWDRPKFKEDICKCGRDKHICKKCSDFQRVE